MGANQLRPAAFPAARSFQADSGKPFSSCLDDVEEREADSDPFPKSTQAKTSAAEKPLAKSADAKKPAEAKQKDTAEQPSPSKDAVTAPAKESTKEPGKQDPAAEATQAQAEESPVANTAATVPIPVAAVPLFPATLTKTLAGEGQALANLTAAPGTPQQLDTATTTAATSTTPLQIAFEVQISQPETVESSTAEGGAKTQLHRANAPNIKDAEQESGKAEAVPAQASKSKDSGRNSGFSDGDSSKESGASNSDTGSAKHFLLDDNIAHRLTATVRSGPLPVERERQVTEAAPLTAAAPKDPLATGTVKSLNLHFESPDGKDILVRVSEAPGGVKIKVHTEDERLAQSYRANLSDLSHQFDRKGIQAVTRTSESGDAAPAASTAASAQEQSRNQERHGQQQRQQEQVLQEWQRRRSDRSEGGFSMSGVEDEWAERIRSGDRIA